MVKNKKRFIIIGIFGPVAIFLMIFFAIKSMRDGVVEVKVAKVSLRDIKNAILSTGSIEAETRVRVSPKIKGRVSELNFDELDYVQKGDIIARLDDTEFVARLNQAKASLIQAKTDHASAAILLRRTKDLFGKGIVSQQELDDAQMLYDIKEAQVSHQEAIVEAIQTELKETVIVSPISGVIIRKYVEEGEMVGLLTVGPSPIVEIARLDSFDVHTNVDETDIGNIRVGMQAEVSVDAWSGVIFDGEVKEIAMLSLERKETGINYVVTVRINNKDNLPLRLGMTSNVNFVVASKEGVPTVPLWAVLERDNEEHVFVVNDSRLHKRVVKTGIKGEEFVEIVSGVEVGQLVVEGSTTGLRDGARARIIEGNEEGIINQDQINSI